MDAELIWTNKKETVEGRVVHFDLTFDIAGRKIEHRLSFSAYLYRVSPGPVKERALILIPAISAKLERET